MVDFGSGQGRGDLFRVAELPVRSNSFGGGNPSGSLKMPSMDGHFNFLIILKPSCREVDGLLCPYVCTDGFGPHRIRNKSFINDHQEVADDASTFSTQKISYGFDPAGLYQCARFDGRHGGHQRSRGTHGTPEFQCPGRQGRSGRGQHSSRKNHPARHASFQG